MMLIPLHSLLATGRARDHRVCHDGQQWLHWSEFSGHVAALTQRLQVRTEARWLLTHNDPYAFIVSLLALLQAGKRAVIPPNTQPGTRHDLAHAFDAIVDEVLPPPMAGAQIALTKLDPQAALIDIYTSGSTGEPKRVGKTLAQFEVELEVLESIWGEDQRSTSIVSSVPHHHFYGLLFRLFWPLYAGRAFDTITCAQPDTLLQRLAFFGQFGRTALVSSPALLSRLPEMISLTSLQPLPHIIFSSGGPLPAAAAAAFHHALAWAPTEVFGSTETGGVAWRRQEGDELWTPMPGLQVGREEDGALLLRSPYLPDMTPWRMDDAVELRAGGRFRLCGRLDRVVKIEEKRLSLPDLEAQLLTHPWVNGAAALALAGRRQSVAVVATLTDIGRRVLELQGKRAVTRQLGQHLAGHFEAVLLPKHWRFPDRLPMNERGKITPAELVALFGAPAQEAKPIPAPVPLPQVRAMRFEGPPDRRERLLMDLYVGPELAHFAGHFPAVPVLPGVVQIDWAARFARQHLGLTGAFERMENIKFLALVLPDATFSLDLKWDPQCGRLDFAYAGATRKYSSGRIVFGGCI